MVVLSMAKVRPENGLEVYCILIYCYKIETELSRYQRFMKAVKMVQDIASHDVESNPALARLLRK